MTDMRSGLRLRWHSQRSGPLCLACWQVVPTRVCTTRGRFCWSHSQLTRLPPCVELAAIHLHADRLWPFGCHSPAGRDLGALAACRTAKTHFRRTEPADLAGCGAAAEGVSRPWQNVAPAVDSRRPLVFPPGSGCQFRGPWPSSRGDLRSVPMLLRSVCVPSPPGSDRRATRPPPSRHRGDSRRRRLRSARSAADRRSPADRHPRHWHG